MNIKTSCMATAIGSFPFNESKEAIDIIFKAMPESPVWPQLPKRGLVEQMEIQYSEGIPRVRIDEEKGRMYFDTSGDYSEEFAVFYENYMTAMDPDSGTGDCSSMAISPEYSRGLYDFEAALKAGGKKFPFVKVHTTGPCSFALTSVDENKRAMFYNEEFRDVIVKALAMKCRWQIQKFKPFADNIICFIDEPILSAFGSSTYISVTRDEVVGLISEVADAIHADNGIAGVHCCGNTDWTLLIDAGLDLINFDAFGFGETIALYPEKMKTFINGGGLLAWGIVPTSLAIREQSVSSLLEKFAKLLDNLASKVNIDPQKILVQSLITPSCGTGSLDIPDAVKVFEILGELSKELKAKYGL